MKAWLRPVLCLLLASAPAALAAAPPAAGLHLAYERFTLPNGLTVLVHTDRSSPSVFVGVWYKTGSRDEPPGKTGFAHLFEHLMFQSTAHRPQEYLSVLQRIGATGANGITKTDTTGYYETVPTNALDTILWLESDRMGYLDGGITQALLDEQRRVVLNEKRQGELRPEEQASRRFLGAFYPAGHPYAHPTIGSTADIEGATLDDVRQWFATHYGTGNAVLVLSGDIDAATAREKVTRYFGGIREGTPISRPLRWAPSLIETRRDLLYGAFAQTRIARSWAVADDDPRDRTLLMLAARAMAGAPDAPLVRALVHEAKVATGVRAALSESELGSVLTVSMDVAPGVSRAAASDALTRALAAYAMHGPAPDRLRRIVAVSDAALLRGLEQPGTVAQWLSDGEIAHDDPGFILKKRSWVADATPSELRGLAARVLGRPYYELTTAPSPTAIASRDVDRSRMPDPGAFRTAITMPPVTRMALANGMTLVVARRAGAGMVDMSLQFPVGTLADARGTAARAFGLLTADEAAAQRLATLGVTVGAHAEDWASAIDLSVAGDRLEQALPLVAGMVRRPAYPAQAVNDANAAASRGLDAYERNPSAAGVALLKRAIWGDADPRGHVVTPQERRDVSRQALLDFHARHVVPGQATLYVVGDVDPQRMRDLAERAFGGWKPAVPAPPQALPFTAPPHTGPRIILVDAPGAGQTSIAVGSVMPPFDKDASAAEALASAVVADVGAGRLNRNLREDKGWSYGFGGGLQDAPSGERLFVASGTVQADRTAQSLTELAREFAAVATTRPLTQAELDGQRDAMMRGAAQRFAGNGAVLSALVTSGAYGLPFDRAASSDRRLAAVTLDQAQAIASRMVRPDALTWVVIGDRRTIEPQLRALHLAPVEVWDVYGRPVR